MTHSDFSRSLFTLLAQLLTCLLALLFYFLRVELREIPPANLLYKIYLVRRDCCHLGSSKRTYSWFSLFIVVRGIVVGGHVLPCNLIEEVSNNLLLLVLLHRRVLIDDLDLSQWVPHSADELAFELTLL